MSILVGERERERNPQFWFMERKKIERRQLPSASGASADWPTPCPDDLSLGFNANSSPSVSSNAHWSHSAPTLNYGFPPEMGMLGLRDFVVVTPPFNHHHHHHLNQDPIMVNDQIHGPNPPTALGVGVIPLLSSAPQNVEDPNSLHNNGRTKFNGMQLWEENPNSSRYLQRSSSVPHNHSSSSVNLVQSSGGSGGSGSTSGPTCQDCGNQAKKDCSFRRCRTCCKSRSFDCPTHVKSTWVSATRRRERQVMAAGATAGLSGSTVGPKKPRLTTSQTAATISHTSTSNATTPRSFDTSSTPQNSGFKEILPAQVRAPAVFKCVRVTAIEDGEDQFAYETVIKIGGHVFKGLLYDQGVDGRTGVSSSSPVLNPYEAANGGGLLGGSNYGNPIN